MLGFARCPSLMHRSSPQSPVAACWLVLDSSLAWICCLAFGLHGICYCRPEHSLPSICLKLTARYMQALNKPWSVLPQTKELWAFWSQVVLFAQKEHNSMESNLLHWIGVFLGRSCSWKHTYLVLFKEARASLGYSLTPHLLHARNKSAPDIFCF